MIPEFYEKWRNRVENQLTILPFRSKPVPKYVEPLPPKAVRRNYIYLLLGVALTLTVAGAFLK